MSLLESAFGGGFNALFTVQSNRSYISALLWSFGIEFWVIQVLYIKEGITAI